MQTFITRLGGVFAGLLPLAEQPEDFEFSPEPGDAASRVEQEEDRLPARDESWDWAMHAHW